MLLNLNVFKAYDIRGIYGQDFDQELAYLLGLAYVELRKNDPDYSSGHTLQIAIATDMRLSSPILKTSLIKGITKAGAEAIDLETISTPTFYFAVGHYNYDGGIMISASHNPKDWNGFKLVRSRSVPISGETGIDFLKKKILLNNFSLANTPGKVIKNQRALSDEITYALSLVDINKIKSFKIIADASSGMGATYLQSLFTKLPINFIPLNFTLDGSFPVHEANPSKEENRRELEEAVLQNRADLGITTDGDGDRVFFIDNEGKTINPAIIRGLLAKVFLADKPGAKIGYDVRPGKITSDLILENGGHPIMTRVGHSLIKEQMLKENIYFAGESSGHFYLQGAAGCFEYPAIMILKLLILFSNTKQKISNYIKPYNKYFSSGEINRQVNDKEAIFQKIKTQYADGKITELDGVSVTYPTFWFNVRGSNTEPLIRLNLEALNKKTMEEKRDEILKLIK